MNWNVPVERQLTHAGMSISIKHYNFTQKQKLYCDFFFFQGDSSSINYKIQLKK